MKKTVLAGIIAFILLTISGPPMLFAATTVDKPDIPSDFLDAARWPKIHTDFCMPSGKEYRTTAYARITDDKKIEYVLTTSLNGTIFRYEYAEGGKEPNIVIDYIRSKNGWMRYNRIIEDITDQFENYLIENEIPPLSVTTVCKKVSSGFGKFWSELFNEIGVK